jgi:hypothetical protein
MSLNPVMNVQEDYPNGSIWNYNDWVKKINDTHQAPLDGIGTSFPSTGLFQGYGFYNISDGKYYCYINGQFRFFKENWNCMVGRGILSGRAFIKNANGYTELANTTQIANNTTQILQNKADIDKINDIAYWRSYHNYNGTLAMSKNENWLKYNHANSSEKKYINYVANGINPYLILIKSGCYIANGRVIISNDSASNPSNSAISIQSTIICNNDIKSMQYITIEWNKWATIECNCMSFDAPANSILEFKLNQCSINDTLLARCYDSFFNVHCVKQY